MKEVTVSCIKIELDNAEANELYRELARAVADTIDPHSLPMLADFQNQLRLALR